MIRFLLPWIKFDPERKCRQKTTPKKSLYKTFLEEKKMTITNLGTLGRCLGTFENIDRGHRTTVYVLYVQVTKRGFDFFKYYNLSYLVIVNVV